MKEEMKALLKSQDMCVLATCAHNRPHCSLMAYTTNDQGDEVYLATLKSTQKYKNLQTSPAVSLLLDTRSLHEGSREKVEALTVSGTCFPMEDELSMNSIRKNFLQKHPHLSNLLNESDAVFMCVRVESFLLLKGPLEAHFVKL